MSNWMDYYTILQVPQNAAQDVIDSAYKSMCKKYHPDINRNPDAENRMKEINIAYEVLGNAQRRRQYHTQWLLKRKYAPMSSAAPFSAPPQSSAAKTAPPPAWTRPKAQAQAKDRGAEAKELVQQYFLHLSSALYKDAYAIISDTDKKNVTLPDFTEWQKAVSGLYILRNHQVLSAQRNPLYELPGGERMEAYRCTIQVTEEDRKTGKVTRYTLHKHVLVEGGRLRVYLGYKDVGNIAETYRNKASMYEDAAILEMWDRYKKSHDVATGLLNFDGFIEESYKEMYRYDRYKVDCCVLLLRLDLPAPATVGATMDSVHSKGNMLDRLEMFVADCLKKHLRCVDIPAIYARQQFLCLLSHTNMRSAQRAIKRLRRLIARDVAGCFDISPRMRIVCRPYNGGYMEEAVEACLEYMARQEASEDRKRDEE